MEKPRNIYSVMDTFWCEMDNFSVIPPQVFEIALDVLLPLLEGCLKQKTPAEVATTIQQKDPIALYYLRKSIRAKLDWGSQGKTLYNQLLEVKPTDSQINDFVNHFNQNKLDYDLV